MRMDGIRDAAAALIAGSASSIKSCNGRCSEQHASRLTDGSGICVGKAAELRPTVDLLGRRKYGQK